MFQTGTYIKGGYGWNEFNKSSSFNLFNKIMKGFFNTEVFTGACGVGGEEMREREFSAENSLFISKINDKADET